MALRAVADLLDELRDDGSETVASAVIAAASGRPLPALPAILESHALLHAAEGELFREAVRVSLRQQGLPVFDVALKTIIDEASGMFGRASVDIRRGITDLRSEVGAPWQADHKNAALAAWIALRRIETGKR